MNNQQQNGSRMGKIEKNPAIQEAIQNGSAKGLLGKLSKEDAKKLNEIMKDKNALSAILESPEAKAIIKAVNERKRNG